MASNSFERFYYQKIALGEGCGCAEQLISTRDLDARAQKAALQRALRKTRGNRLAWLARLIGGYGQKRQALRSGPGGARPEGSKQPASSSIKT